MILGVDVVKASFGEFRKACFDCGNNRAVILFPKPPGLEETFRQALIGTWRNRNKHSARYDLLPNFISDEGCRYYSEFCGTPSGSDILIFLRDGRWIHVRSIDSEVSYQIRAYCEQASSSSLSHDDKGPQTWLRGQ